MEKETTASEAGKKLMLDSSESTKTQPQTRDFPTASHNENNNIQQEQQQKIAEEESLLCSEELEIIYPPPTFANSIPVSSASAAEIAAAASTLEAALSAKMDVYKRTKGAAAPPEEQVQARPMHHSNTHASGSRADTRGVAVTIPSPVDVGDVGQGASAVNQKDDNNNKDRNGSHLPPDSTATKKRKIPDMLLNDRQKAVATMSRHVMADWSELGLGETSGSGAWNATLRTQFIRSGSDHETTVPQLSPAECLHRLQQIMRLPTIIPPDDSPLVKSGKMSSNAPIFDELRNVYREMIQQDVSDGTELRRELRFTSAEEVRNRMRRAEQEMAILSERERDLVEIDWSMRQEVNRIKGLL